MTAKERLLLAVQRLTEAEASVVATNKLRTVWRGCAGAMDVSQLEVSAPVHRSPGDERHHEPGCGAINFYSR